MGLAAALPLACTGISGALLVGARPLDRLINRHLFESPTQGRRDDIAAALDAIQVRLAHEFPGADLSFRLPESVRDALRVYVRGAWDGEIFLSPAGAELGRRGAHEGFFNLLFEVHSTLLSDVGGSVLFVVALSFLVLFGVGMIAWWPRRLQHAVSLELRRGARRAIFDVHRLAGALAGALVLLSVASGAYMAFKPISTWVDRLADSSIPVLPPVHFDVAHARLPLSRIVAIADAALPGGRVTIVQWPAARERAVRVRKRMPDEVHPNGLSSIWLDAYTGNVLRATRWDDGGAGLIGYEYLYPLHIGALGGTAHRWVIALIGLLLASLAVSGAWVWANRRRAEGGSRRSAGKRNAGGGR